MPLTDAHYFVRGYSDKTNFTIILTNTDITYDIIEVGGVYENFILTLTYSDFDISRDFINSIDIDQSFELLETNLMQREVIKGEHIVISGMRKTLHIRRYLQYNIKYYIGIFMINNSICRVQVMIPLLNL